MAISFSGSREQHRSTDAGLAAERSLVLEAREQGGPARDELIEAFLPLIGSIARIYRSSTAVDRAELMQEGVVGLLRALERYDETLGTPFWAYASWWVRQAMQHLVAELTRSVVLSDRALRQLARVKDARAEFVRARGSEPTLMDIAEGSGLSIRQVQSLMTAEREPRGLGEPIGGDSGGSTTFGDMVADPHAEEAFDELATRADLDEIPRLLDELTERELAVVRARYGLDGEEQTLRELGGRLGVSAERVRQIEQAALEKMRAAMALTPAEPAAGARFHRVAPI